MCMEKMGPNEISFSFLQKSHPELCLVLGLGGLVGCTPLAGARSEHQQERGGSLKSRGFKEGLFVQGHLHGVGDKETLGACSDQSIIPDPGAVAELQDAARRSHLERSTPA